MALREDHCWLFGDCFVAIHSTPEATTPLNSGLAAISTTKCNNDDFYLL
jgi:hypothetical protein